MGKIKLYNYQTLDEDAFIRDCKLYTNKELAKRYEKGVTTIQRWKDILGVTVKRVVKKKV